MDKPILCTLKSFTVNVVFYCIFHKTLVCLQHKIMSATRKQDVQCSCCTNVSLHYEYCLSNTSLFFLLGSSLLHEHVPGHGEYHRRSYCLGLPQTNADGTGPLHTWHTHHQGHNGEGINTCSINGHVHKWPPLHFTLHIHCDTHFDNLLFTVKGSLHCRLTNLGKLFSPLPVVCKMAITDLCEGISSFLSALCFWSLLGLEQLLQLFVLTLQNSSFSFSLLFLDFLGHSYFFSPHTPALKQSKQSTQCCTRCTDSVCGCTSTYDNCMVLFWASLTLFSVYGSLHRLEQIFYWYPANLHAVSLSYLCLGQCDLAGVCKSPEIFWGLDWILQVHHELCRNTQHHLANAAGMRTQRGLLYIWLC